MRQRAGLSGVATIGSSDDTSTKTNPIALKSNADADAHRGPQQSQIVQLDHSNVYIPNENDHYMPKSKQAQGLQNLSQASSIKDNMTQPESYADHTVAGPMLAAGATAR